MILRCLWLIVSASLLVITGCSESVDDAARNQQTDDHHQSRAPLRNLASDTRWYSEQQVQNGKVLFLHHCAECHKPDASGTANWRQPDVNGKYPPPPLNGTAHTWHHHLDGLRRTVRDGGVSLGGSMPGFADKLSAQEVDAVLAWIQSNWPDEVYAAWQNINAQATN